jgi:MoaA/NifB/PqqE/SkfB family radical SAM enzyme
MAQMISNDGLSLEHRNIKVQGLSELFNRSLASVVKPFNLGKINSRYFHLALGLTKRCTLRCVYCHAEAGDEDDMSPELIEQAISHSFRSAAEKELQGVNISFAVGGEPTSNFPL